MFDAIVWDDRDTEATEPSSTLGVYFTEDEAYQAITSYLQGEHGSHIYKYVVWDTRREWETA